MSQWIQNGVLDQYVYFEAPPGLGTWVVYGSRNGAAATIFTTPTIAELGLGTMPGCYSLLLDEQTTMAAGNTTEILKLYVSAAGWGGASIEVTLFDELPVNVVQANSVDVGGSGTELDPWGPA